MLPNCDTCGRFFNPMEPGTSWVFVPDTPFTHEEVRSVCRPCTEKHGPPLPRQSVNVEACSGIIPASTGATDE